MIKHIEDLSLADKVRHAARHRRVHGFPSDRAELHPLTVAEEESRPAAETKPERKPVMRVLLLHAKTHKYLQSAARWTKNSKRARDFHNGWWAAIHAFTMNPRHLVIQYEFDDERYNLNIPVLGRARA